MKVLVLSGLPASGKSTFAKELIAKDKSYVRVCRDDLRESMFNYKFSRPNEGAVRRLRDFMILDTLTNGRNVVIDETNLNPKNMPHYRQLVSVWNPEFEEKFFDKPLKQCIEDDLKRPRSVGSKVIQRMYDDFLAPTPVIYVPPKDKPKAIVVDIDGTLAHMTGRSPYDYTRVNEDRVDEVVRSIVRRYHDDKYKVILCSGRESSARVDTLQWLADNHIPFDFLYMRQEGDSRSDNIVKLEIFDQHIRDDYNVEFVLDDRNRVVEAWRSIGLKVLQVAEGDF